MIKHAFAAVLLLASASAFGADVEPPADGALNPAPAAPFNTYQRFELQPVAMGAPFAGQKGNEVAREKLQANLDERAVPLLKEWNATAAGEEARTLRILPEIRYIRFITGGKRFFAGAFAGGSSIMVTVKITDAATGAVVAEPDFYQHANAMGAAWSFGATDKTMLIRISNMVTEYLRANYAQTVAVPISEAPDISN